MKRVGSSFVILPRSERRDLYEAVLYEIASTFCVPSTHDDLEVRESVYMRVMISIRNLTHFFDFDPARKYHPQEVFAWQFFDDPSLSATFIGPQNSPAISPADLSKISKQIAHIARDRPSFSGVNKRWNVELREALRPICLNFVDCLIQHNVSEIDPKIVRGFQKTARVLRFKSSLTQPDPASNSNTAFKVMVVDLDPVPSESFSIVKFLE